MRMKVFWMPMCLALGFVLTACGGGDSPPLSTQGQYSETPGSNGERVVVMSPQPGQVVHLGDTVKFVVRLENARWHPTPTPEAIQAAYDYWQAKHTAGAPPITELKMAVAGGDLPLPTTPAAGWLYHTSVANHPTAGTAISHLQAAGVVPTSDGDTLIYSFPAADLISNFSNHHLGNFGNSNAGLMLNVHTALHDIDGNSTGASTSVPLTVVP